MCARGADWQEEHVISLVLPSVRFGKFLLSLLLAPDDSHTETRRSAHLDSLLPQEFHGVPILCLPPAPFTGKHQGQG